MGESVDSVRSGGTVSEDTGSEGEARVIFSAYGEVADIAVPDGVAFVFDPEVLEALFGAEYAERVVRSWKDEGVFERVTDDIALAITDGRATLRGDGTNVNPYQVEVEEGG
jgi:hypothetical protein